MSTPANIQETSEGLLLPKKVYEHLGEIEIVEQRDAIIIRSKDSQLIEPRELARRTLRRAGLLVELGWDELPDVSPTERTELARKLGQAGPLSKLVAEDREAGW